MQKRIPRNHAERSDPTIHSLPNGVAMLAQAAVVRGDRNRAFSASRRKYVEPEKLISYPSKFASVTNALEYFAENHVGKTDPLQRHLAVKPLRFRIGIATEIINPNGRVHNNHSKSPGVAAQAGFFKISFPFHFASKSPHANLGARLDEQTKSRLYHSPLRINATEPHCLAHQLVIDIDIGSHFGFPLNV
jgi:hypothetical protein